MRIPLASDYESQQALPPTTSHEPLALLQVTTQATTVSPRRSSKHTSVSPRTSSKAASVSPYDLSIATSVSPRASSAATSASLRASTNATHLSPHTSSKTKSVSPRKSSMAPTMYSRAPVLPMCTPAPSSGLSIYTQTPPNANIPQRTSAAHNALSVSPRTSLTVSTISPRTSVSPRTLPTALPISPSNAPSPHAVHAELVSPYSSSPHISPHFGLGSPHGMLMSPQGVFHSPLGPAAGRMDRQAVAFPSPYSTQVSFALPAVPYGSHGPVDLAPTPLSLSIGTPHTPLGPPPTPPRHRSRVILNPHIMTSPQTPRYDYFRLPGPPGPPPPPPSYY